ncbi:MAG: HD domain-containing protein [Oscillospiraceae bacterium]|nr:HD domain-containing protein [Oscillospiraceae bacterium]
MNKENVEFFKATLSSVVRDGIADLLRFIEKSDFYTAPASTRFHGAFEGGLLEHSIQVYNCLMKKKHIEGTVWHDVLSDVSDESIAISALLHDLCKTYFYSVEMRNKKVDGNWIQVPSYRVEDKIPYGHGEKSVMMIEEYIKLKPVERYAIRWHMGPYSGERDWSTLASAMDKYPLVMALFEADMEASHLIEK